MSLVQIQMFASDHIINDTFVVQLETKLENSILAILSRDGGPCKLLIPTERTSKLNFICDISKVKQFIQDFKA